MTVCLLIFAGTIGPMGNLVAAGDQVAYKLLENGGVIAANFLNVGPKVPHRHNLRDAIDRIGVVEGAALEVIEDDLAQAQVRIVVLLNGDVITQFERDILEHLVRAAASRFDNGEDILPQRIPKERLDAGAGHHDRLSEQEVEAPVHGERFGYPDRGPCQHRHTIITGMLNDGVSGDLPVRTDRQTQVFAEF